MRKFSLFALILLITMSNCNNKKEIEKQLTSGIDKANLDVSVSPKEDFYQSSKRFCHEQVYED